MSVIIRGMKMPKNCLMCQFHGLGGYKNELIVCSLTGRSEGQLSNVPDCPLVEVPTPHGRLKDSDDLLAIFNADARSTSLAAGVVLEGVCKTIATAPTILEAEEGE